MKNVRKLNGVSMVVALIAYGMSLSTYCNAASYHASVQLPTLHAKDYVYTAHLQVPNSIGTGLTINAVNWSWNVHGWPKGLQVYLCQTPTRCVDVSRQRIGSTSMFNGIHYPHALYYEMKLSHPGRAPVAGLLGGVTVEFS